MFTYQLQLAISINNWNFRLRFAEVGALQKLHWDQMRTIRMGRLMVGSFGKYIDANFCISDRNTTEAIFVRDNAS